MTRQKWNRERISLAWKKTSGKVWDWFIRITASPEPEQDESHAATRYAQACKEEDTQNKRLTIWQFVGCCALGLIAFFAFVVWVIVMFYAQTPWGHP